MNSETNISFERARDAEVGTIFLDRFDNGLRFIVMRGPCSITAYIGIPEGHPLADHSYDDLPVRAHGGLTYSGFSEKGTWPKGYFWYGWDYAHCGDQPFYDRVARENEKPWSVDEVAADSWETLYDFGHLAKLAEAIHNRAISSKQVAEPK